MKRCLVAIVLGSSLAATGCTLQVKQTPYIKAETLPSQVLEEGLEYIAKRDYAAARSHLDKYQNKTPSIRFVLAMTYAADGTIFNGGLLRSGLKLENLIYSFRDHPEILATMQDKLKPLFKLKAYHKFKADFKKYLIFSPKKLIPMYAFMSTLDAQHKEKPKDWPKDKKFEPYEEAANAWYEAAKRWENKIPDYVIAFGDALETAELNGNHKRARGFALIRSKLRKLQKELKEKKKTPNPDSKKPKLQN